MIKYYIRDDEGNKYEVTEEEVPSTDCGDDEEEIITDDDEEILTDDEGLTPDEISALKSLAACASKLLALVKPASTTDDDEEVEEVVTDDDEEIVESTADEDEIERTTTGDSRASFGSWQRPIRRDSYETTLDKKEAEIADVWSKRYKSQLNKGE